VVAVFLDGKSFAEDQMVLALGTTLNGDKVLLGFVQTDTENTRAIKIFLRLKRAVIGTRYDVVEPSSGSIRVCRTERIAISSSPTR